MSIMGNIFAFIKDTVFNAVTIMGVILVALSYYGFREPSYVTICSKIEHMETELCPSKGCRRDEYDYIHYFFLKNGKEMEKIEVDRTIFSKYKGGDLYKTENFCFESYNPLVVILRVLAAVMALVLFIYTMVNLT